MPDRIQLRRTPGWRLPDGAVNVARPSKFGNPFTVGGRFVTPGLFGATSSPYAGVLPVGAALRRDKYVVGQVVDGNHAVALFIDWIKHEPAWKVEYLAPELAGRDLACWCPLPEPGEPDICHAAALIAWVNGGRFWTPEWADSDGVKHLTVKRCCNGCGAPLGDVRDEEITIDGDLIDVRAECPTCSAPTDS